MTRFMTYIANVLWKSYRTVNPPLPCPYKRP